MKSHQWACAFMPCTSSRPGRPRSPQAWKCTSHSSTSTLPSSRGDSTAAQNQSGMLLLMASSSIEAAVALEMEIDVAEQRVDHGQALEIVAHRQFLGHT